MNDALLGFCAAASIATATILAACEGGGTSGGGGNGGAGSGAGQAGTGANGAGGIINIGGGTPMFESDIVPIFQKSCGATDASCHAANAYAASPNFGCRGWLSLENTPQGSQYYDAQSMTWVPTPAPGCPDLELYRRLLDLTSWEECNGAGVRYVVPCDPDASYVWHKVDGGPYCGPPDESDPMPPDETFDPVEKETLRQWILAGAPRVDGTVDACAAPSTTSTSTSTSTGTGMAQDPVPVITHPGSNEVRPSANPVPFIGSANDPQDGALSGASLQWSSDLDGDIGSGETFNALLSAGIHTITLQATDSDGNVGLTTITNLEMTP